MGTCQSPQLCWSLEPAANGRRFSVSAQLVESNGSFVIEKNGAIRFKAGRVAISVEVGWAAFVEPVEGEGDMLKVYDLVRGDFFSESCANLVHCSRPQVLYHLVANGSTLVYTQSGSAGGGSTIKLMKVHLDPISLTPLSSNQITGPVMNLAIHGDMLALARWLEGVELYHVTTRTGLAKAPSCTFKGWFWDVSLAPDFVMTLGTLGSCPISHSHYCADSSKGTLAVWSVRPLLCIWELELNGHPVSASGMGTKLKDDPLQVQRIEELVDPLEKSAHSDTDQHMDGCSEEPAAQIGPGLAVQIQRSLWESSIEWFARSGASSSTSGVLQQQTEDAIVLLSFSRRPAELKQVVLASSLASELRDRGVDVQPPWAGGAIVLVEDLSPKDVGDDFGTWNVAVGESEEHRIHQALRELPYNIRPRLKPKDGRQYVPGHTELFGLSGDEASSGVDAVEEYQEGDDGFSMTSDDSGHTLSGSETHQYEIYVDRTFLHVRPLSTARSLPNTI